MPNCFCTFYDNFYRWKRREKPQFNSKYKEMWKALWIFFFKSSSNGAIQWTLKLYTCLRKCVHRMQIDLNTFSILTKYFNYIKKRDAGSVWPTHKMQECYSIYFLGWNRREGFYANLIQSFLQKATLLFLFTI